MSDLQPNITTSIIPSSVSDITPAPMLRIPQVPPSQVIATRRRSIVPVVRLQPLLQHTPFPQSPVTPMQPVPFEEQTAQTPFPILSGSIVYAIPTDEVQQLSFPTPLPLPLSTPGISGVTYIPKAMKRHKEPTVVDALIACATLLLLGLCALMLLYYFSR